MITFVYAEARFGFLGLSGFLLFLLFLEELTLFVRRFTMVRCAAGQQLNIETSLSWICSNFFYFLRDFSRARGAGLLTFRAYWTGFLNTGFTVSAIETHHLGSFSTFGALFLRLFGATTTGLLLRLLSRFVCIRTSRIFAATNTGNGFT